jgi:hypothetical protein
MRRSFHLVFPAILFSCFFPVSGLPAVSPDRFGTQQTQSSAVTGTADGRTVTLLKGGEQNISVSGGNFVAAFPQLAVGGGCQTVITIVNLTNQAQSYDVTWIRKDGTAILLDTNFDSGRDVATGSGGFHGTLPPLVSDSWLLTLPSPTVQTGTAFVNYDTSSVASFMTFQSIDGAGNVTGQATVLPSAGGKSFAMAVLVGGYSNLQMGLAISSVTDTGTANITLTLYDFIGRQIAQATKSLPPLNETAAFLNEFLPVMPASFRGSLTISSDTDIVAVGLQFAGTVFATFPATAMNTSLASASSSFDAVRTSASLSSSGFASSDVSAVAQGEGQTFSKSAGGRTFNFLKGSVDPAVVLFGHNYEIALTPREAFPQLVVDGGWQTLITVVNLGGQDEPYNGAFWGNNGHLLELETDINLGNFIVQTYSAFFESTLLPYTAGFMIEAHSSFNPITGTFSFTPTTGTLFLGYDRTSVAGFMTFQSVDSMGHITGMATVLPSLGGRSFIMPVVTGGPSNLSMGFAVSNVSTTNTANITLSLIDTLGTQVGQASFYLPPLNETAKYMSEFFPSLPANFTGSLFITSDNDIAAVGVQFSGTVFATFPVTATH